MFELDDPDDNATDPETARKQRTALSLAAALRAQPTADATPQGLARQRAVGLLAILSGNKQMGGIGDALVSDAQHQTQTDMMGQRYALDRAIKDANEKRQEARDAAENSFRNRQLGIVDTQRRDLADQRSQDRADALAQRASEFQAKAAKEKEVPPRQLERYAQLGGTIDALGQYDQQLGKAATGPIWGRVQAINPLKGGDTAAALGTREMLKVKVARALHGGVPSAVELSEADQYLPSSSDTDDQRNSKMIALRQLLSDEQTNLRNTYGEGGLHIGNLSTSGGGAAASKPVRRFTWANGQLVEVK